MPEWLARESHPRAALRDRAWNEILADGVKPKKDRDQAAARQRQNLEIDIRADALDGSANSHRA